MANERKSLAGRALAALALLIGFYVLVTVVALALIVAPVLEWMLADRLHIGILLLPVAGVSLLWSLKPRRARFEPPGPRFDPSTQPHLTAMIHEVAAKVGQPVPAETYLLDDMNAFVSQVGGVLGIGGRRVLAVGVPLMRVTESGELASVIAHEFGHFHGGDTRLGPLVYQTRAAIGRTLDATSGSALHRLFIAYATLYLRVTQAISREQEFSADRLAATVTDAATTASALARLPVGSMALEAYQQQEYYPVLRAGFQPPYLAGFEQFLASSSIREQATAAVDRALGSTEGSRFDSHPPLAERIRALGQDPALLAARPLPEAPAFALLQDPAGVERALVARQLGSESPALPSIEWTATGDAVLLPTWLEQVALLAAARPALTAAEVPTTPDELADLGEQVSKVQGRALPRPSREQMARSLSYSLIGASAAHAGWRVLSDPGEAVDFCRGDEVVAFLTLYTDALEGRLSGDELRRTLAAAGMTSTAGELSPGPQQEAVDGAPMGLDRGVATVVQAPDIEYHGSFKKRGIGKSFTLDIAGDRVDCDGVSVTAGAAQTVAYSYGDNGNGGLTLEVWLHAAAGTAHFKTSVSTKKDRAAAAEGWQTLVDWVHRNVVPRLVDGYLDRLRASDQVTIAGVTVTSAGVQSSRGEVVPFNQVVDADFTGARVTLYRSADNLERRSKLVSAKSAEPDAVLLAEVVSAAAATSRS